MGEARFIGGPEDSDEFYVGYLAQAPSGVAAFTKKAVAVLAVAALTVAAVAAFFQNPPASSAWPEAPVSIKGYVLIDPYPRLIVDDEKAGTGGQRSILLCAEGKFGLLSPTDYCGPNTAEAARRALDAVSAEQRLALKEAAGKYIELRGTTLRREGREMMEVSSSGVELRRSRDALVADPRSRLGLTMPAEAKLGTVTLKGEIADPKCYFGAMKPGSGITHKACAMRCISGGIVPVLIAKDTSGAWLHYILTDAAGRPCNLDVLPLAGEPVSVTGELTRKGDALFLAIKGVERL